MFISHSTRDKTAADAACAALEAAGIRCWIAPRDITPGAEWGEAIIEAINQCRVMVLIFSTNANESSQIRREVERAVSKGTPIIPLRIEDIAPARSLEYFIGNVHWLDAMTPPLEAHLRRLVESVKALLKIAPVPAPALMVCWIAGGAGFFLFNVLLGGAVELPGRSRPAPGVVDLRRGGSMSSSLSRFSGWRSRSLSLGEGLPRRGPFCDVYSVIIRRPRRRVGVVK